MSTPSLLPAPTSGVRRDGPHGRRHRPATPTLRAPLPRVPRAPRPGLRRHRTPRPGPAPRRTPQPHSREGMTHVNERTAAQEHAAQVLAVICSLAITVGIIASVFAARAGGA